MDNLPFDEHYQQHFLNHLLRDSEFTGSVITDVKPEMFGNEIDQRLVRIVAAFWKENKAAPGTLLFRYLDDLKGKNLLHESLHDNLCKRVDGLFVLPLQNRKFLVDQFNTFSRKQLIKASLPQFMEDVKKGDFDEAYERLKKIFQFRPAKADDLGQRFTVDPTARIQRRREQDPTRFWTLIPELDQRVDGSKKGEITIWQSQTTSAGKSAALVYLARSAIAQGKKVLIYSLEMGKESYEDRLDMCMTGLTREELDQGERIEDTLKFLYKFGGDIWLKTFPAGITKISNLRQHQQTLANTEGFHADVVLLDYLDLVAPENSELAGDLHATGNQVTTLFRGWMQEEETCGHTAAQSGRAAGEQAFADIHHMAGSIAKAYVCDVLLSINRTQAEAAAGLTNIWVLKNREGPARYPIQIHSNFAKMAFRTGAPD